MGLVAPIFAAFAVLAGVPIAIHLFGRPRAEKKKFAALVFLLKSERQSAPRRRVREVLLLVARACVIALVPLILAKPWLDVRQSEPSGIGSGHAESDTVFG
jgi:hypothetical protein